MNQSEDVVRRDCAWIDVGLTSTRRPITRSLRRGMFGGVPRGPTTRHHEAVSADRRQTLRVLEGRFVVDHATDGGGGAADTELLVLVRGPDGRTGVRRDDSAGDAWVALWNGDEAHDLQATGMLSAVVAPLAAAELPVWVASSFDGDLILVPAGRLDEAAAVLREAGHRVVAE